MDSRGGLRRRRERERKGLVFLDARRVVGLDSDLNPSFFFADGYLVVSEKVVVLSHHPGLVPLLPELPGVS